MLRRVFHGSLGSVSWKFLGIGSPGFENAVLSRLMHSMTTSFSITAIASNGSLAERAACALAAFLDNALAAFLPQDIWILFWSWWRWWPRN